MAPTDGQDVSSPMTVRVSAATPKGFESLAISVGDNTYNPVLNGEYYEAEVSVPETGEYTISATLVDDVKQATTGNINVNVTSITEASAFDIFRILGLRFI
jgi:hypothetical protein